MDNASFNISQWYYTPQEETISAIESSQAIFTSKSVSLFKRIFPSFSADCLVVWVHVG